MKDARAFNRLTNANMSEAEFALHLSMHANIHTETPHKCYPALSSHLLGHFDLRSALQCTALPCVKNDLGGAAPAATDRLPRMPRSQEK